MIMQICKYMAMYTRALVMRMARQVSMEAIVRRMIVVIAMAMIASVAMNMPMVMDTVTIHILMVRAIALITPAAHQCQTLHRCVHMSTKFAAIRSAAHKWRVLDCELQRCA